MAGGHAGGIVFSDSIFKQPCTRVLAG